MKNPIIFSAAIIVVLLLIYSTLFAVDETQYVIVTQFGRPVKTIKDAGLNCKWFFQRNIYFDNRLQVYDPPPSEFLTQDKKNLVISNFICWRVVDPERFLKGVTDITGAELRLHDLAWGELSAVIGNYPLSSLVSTDAEQLKFEELLDKVAKNCRDTALKEYGIEIADVKIKRFNFPEQNKESVFQRMRSERQRIAKQYRAEGEEEALKVRAEADKQVNLILAEAYKQAEQTKGEGDAQAIRIYAEAYNQDPQFYKFLRTLESYRKFLDDKTTVVLSSDSELLKLLTSGASQPKDASSGKQR